MVSRELDVQVAEKVMRLYDVHLAERGEWLQIEMDFALVVELVYWGDKGLTSLPHYSTDIAAAWQVLEKMRSDRWRVSLWTDGDQWHVQFEKGMDYSVKANEVTEAICKAALKAKEGEA